MQVCRVAGRGRRILRSYPTPMVAAHGERLGGPKDRAFARHWPPRQECHGSSCPCEVHLKGFVSYMGGSWATPDRSAPLLGVSGGRNTETAQPLN